MNTGNSCFFIFIFFQAKNLRGKKETRLKKEEKDTRILGDFDNTGKGVYARGERE
jgi:hypothetical protein